jgi:prepilin-type N-terminal cleavage/methylation domain-containing protein
MKNGKNKRGFTIMEMLVVVAVMAIIATLATGAVIKSLKTMRYKRISSTRTALGMALNNYRAQKNEWPFDHNQMQRAKRDRTLYYAYEQNNQYVSVPNSVVFEELFESGKAYIDVSALLTMIDGRRMTVKQAIDQGLSNITVGYPNPENTKEFQYFGVRYNSVTDSVNVYTKHEMENDPNKLGEDFR